MGRLVPIGAALILFGQLVCLWQVRVIPKTRSAQPEKSVGIVAGSSPESAAREEDWKYVQRLLRQVNQCLKDVVDTRGVIKKQERWGKYLEPTATVEFEQLTAPYSIYLKWQEPNAGREVLFQQGQHDDRLVVLESTPLGTLAPTFSLSLDHKLAKQVSRHPLTEFSLEYIRGEMRRYVSRGKRDPNSELLIDKRCDLNGIRCRHVRIVHPRREGSAPKDYHRIDMYFRSEDTFPLRWEKYGWPLEEGDSEPPLLEYFELLEVQTNQGLTAQDFKVDRRDFGFGSLLIPLD